MVKQEERDIPLQLLDPHPRQPRLDFDRAAITRLARSLKDADIGLLQSILVRPKGDRYELLAGHRRVRAATEAGWDTIPATVRFVDDQTALRILLLENLEREQLNPLERAFAISELRRPVEDGGAGMSVEAIAAAFSRCETWVKSTLRLLALKEPWRSRLICGEIDESKAELVLQHNDQPAVQRAIDDAIQERPEAWRTRKQWRSNVREIENTVDDTAIAETSKRKKGRVVKPPSRPSRRKTSTPKPVVLDRTLTDRDVGDLLRPFTHNRGDLVAIRQRSQSMIDKLDERKAKAG